MEKENRHVVEEHIDILELTAVKEFRGNIQYIGHLDLPELDLDEESYSVEEFDNPIELGRELKASIVKRELELPPLA